MYTASCHCGAVLLEMQRRPRRMTQCNCSLCRRYGALWAYFQRKSVRVLAEGDALEVYSWRNNRFEFFHCTTCGCVTHYERADKRPDGSDMGAVNLRNIDDPAIVAGLPIRLLDGASSWKVLDEAPQPHLLRSPEP
ncbi:MAG TPA: GFA family protein [Kiloniellaceae bacterium]|nr:GFA family protein [Kiloniellaceae bacterium]HIP77009.1 GFA family protein [Kiloniellaceae bacterium]